jgi:hypothetical protein
MTRFLMVLVVAFAAALPVRAEVQIEEVGARAVHPVHGAGIAVPGWGIVGCA